MVSDYLWCAYMNIVMLFSIYFIIKEIFDVFIRHHFGFSGRAVGNVWLFQNRK